MTASIVAGSSSLSGGASLAFTFGQLLWVCWNNGTSDIGSRTQMLVPFNGTISLAAPDGVSGQHTLCGYAASTGGSPVIQSGPVTLTPSGGSSGSSSQASPAAIVAAT